MSESQYPSQQQDKFVLRLPDGMRDRIKAAAEANNRSMNAEIVARLEMSLQLPNGAVLAPVDEVESIVRSLMDEMKELRKRVDAVTLKPPPP